MARAFVAGSSQSLDRSGAALSGPPLTFACWVKPTTSAANMELISLNDGATQADQIDVRIRFNGVIAAQSNHGGASVSQAGSVTNGVWCHACAVHASASSRRAYKDGVAGTLDTSTINVSGLTNTTIGAWGTTSNFADAVIAEAAIWNVALDADEVAALAKGISPLLIRPTALVAYWPLFGNDSPELDRWKNRYDLTVTGATKADHPRQYYAASTRSTYKRGAAQLAGASGLTWTPAGALRSTAVLSGATTLTWTPDARLVAQSRFAGASTLTFDISGRLPKPTDPTILIGGIDKTPVLKLGSVIVDDDTLSFQTVRGYLPTESTEIIIQLGPSARIWAGHLERVRQFTLGKETDIAADVTGTGYPAFLNRLFPIRRYVNVSVSTIVADLVSSFSTGFTTTNVVGSLPAITIDYDGTQGLWDCIAQAAREIGAPVCRVDFYRDVHLAYSESAVAPDPINDSNAHIFNLEKETAAGQLKTRVYVRGKSASVRLGGATLAAGATRLPLTDASMFDASGGTIWLAAERGAYSGRFTALDGNGAVMASRVVGPLQSPSAPSPSKVTGGGQIQGTVGYRISFVLGDRGESEVSAASSTAACTAVSAAGNANFATSAAAGPFVAGESYLWAVTFVTAVVNFNGLSVTGETGITNWSGVTISTSGKGIDLSAIPTSGDGRVVARKIYRTRNGGTGAGPFYLVATLNDNTTTTYTDATADANLGAIGPMINSTGDSVSLASIQTGPSGTTARRIYRTAGGGSVYRYLATLSDNTTTTYTDTKGDGELGDNAPASSHVSTLAGSSSLRVSDLAQFQAGGWVDSGGMLIAYTGRSGSSGEGTLTGVPATGTGAITADIAAGNTATAVPTVTLSSGSTYSIADGDTVRPYVRRDDAAAQAVLAAREGGTGVHEHVITHDALTTITAMNAIGDAELSLFAASLITAKYATRDLKTERGKLVSVNRTSQGWSASLPIQHVRITQIGEFDGVVPLFEVEASSVRFTLEDVMQQVLHHAATVTG